MRDLRLSGSVPSISQPSLKELERRKTGCGFKKICILFAAVVVTLAVVGGVIAVGFILGVREDKETIKEVTVTLYDQTDSTETRQQEIMVSGEEEVYTSRDRMTIIFNFKTGLMVAKYLRMENQPCMMSYFNDSQLASPEKLVDSFQGKKVVSTVVNTTVYSSFYGNGYKVKPYLLSEKMQELCEGVDTVWVAREESMMPAEEKARRKRQVADQAGCTNVLCFGHYTKYEELLSIQYTACRGEALVIVTLEDYMAAAQIDCIELFVHHIYTFEECKHMVF